MIMMAMMTIATTIKLAMTAGMMINKRRLPEGLVAAWREGRERERELFHIKPSIRKKLLIQNTPLPLIAPREPDRQTNP